MKLFNSLKMTAIVLLLALLSAGSPAFSKDYVLKVAIVDVMQVVQRSPEINALKTDRENKLQDLARFVETARTTVEKEKNLLKKKSLEDGYNKELNLRKDVIDKDYVQKLSDIDKDITMLINTKAKELGYDLILAKNGVLGGGTDITAEIIKELK